MFDTKSADGSRVKRGGATNSQTIEKAVGAREAGTSRKEDVRLAYSINQLVYS